MAQGETRKLAAIMFTDMVGFSRQMGSNEARMLRLLDVHNQLIQQAVAEHHGTVIKTVGDAFLVDFPSVVHAVQCARHIQAQFCVHNADKDTAEQIHVRIGIHLGDIVQRDGDVFGDGVNIASRLQELAAPDTTCISHIVYQEVEKKLSLGTVVSLGRPKLKNIAQRQAIYALLSEKPKGVRQNLRVQWLKLSRRVGTAHRVAMVVLLFILVSVGAIALRERYFSSSPGLPLPDKPSIVVLPFVNMSNDPEQEYFSDGITEDITSDLSTISSLFVLARNSAFTYKGKAVKVQDLSREMGVQYVLEGSVRKADDRLRVTAQLIDGITGGHLWSERYDRPLTDIFAVQDEIVQKIVTTLKLQLTLWEHGLLVRKHTNNLEAYDYYLRAREYHDRYSKQAHTQERQMLEKALVLDPQYAEAYVRLGLIFTWEWIAQWNQDPQILEQAFALAQKAVALDDSLPQAYQLLSHISRLQKKIDQAVVEAERAVTLDPNDAEGYAFLAQALNAAGQPEKAREAMEKAMRLNPRYPAWYSTFLGGAYSALGQDEQAIATLKEGVVRNPKYLWCHVLLASIYGRVDREEEAQVEAAEILRISPNFSLEGARQIFFNKNPEAVEHFIDGLRKAGLK